MTELSPHDTERARITRRSLLGAAATAVVAGTTAAKLLQNVGQEQYDDLGGLGLVVAQHELEVVHVPLAEATRLSASGLLPPFVSVGLSVPPHLDAELLAQTFLRTRGASGWTDWIPAPFMPDEGPDGDEARLATNRLVSQPLWVGFGDALDVEAPVGVAGDLTVHFVRELPRVVAHHDDLVTAASPGPRPTIRPRSAWNARSPRQALDYDSTLALAIVHHTAGGNGYSAAQVPGIIAANQAYHQDSLGWNDLAYNFVIDRFGQIWEGRAGGITRLARGGHTAGFNSRTTGVCALGNFETVSAPQGMLSAYHALLGWKLGLHGVDPTTTVRYTAGTGSRSSHHPAGTTREVPRVVGHGDVGATACPGRNLRPHVPAMRSGARARQGGFPDVPGNAYYATAVAWLTDTKITTGVGNTGLFKPDDPVTRDQMATFLWRMMDSPTGHRAHGFRDVPSNSYYERPVRWLRAADITDGMGGPGLYSPGSVVTRGQMVTFLWRMSGRRSGYPAHRFTDVPSNAFYADAVRWASATRITTGVGGTNRFAPNDRVTRGQMAAFLHRLATTRSAWASPRRAPSTVRF
jgi:hypothetical protein